MGFTLRSAVARRAALTVFLTAALLSTAIAANQEVVLYTFTGGADGGFPSSGLISDAAGNLYGTTAHGGTANNGTVFELQHSGAGWTEVVLYSFTGGADGSVPQGGLVMDKAGNLYGTTSQGGANVFGTVFELSRSANGWTKTTLFNFAAGADGGTPGLGSMVFDRQGNLYGTTQNFGTYGYGVVFELSPVAGGGWTETVLHSFANTASDGGYPSAVILDGLGNLYGTTGQGGANHHGTVFELSPSGGGVWQETILHNFADNTTDGGDPLAAPTIAAGRLFGSTPYGGHYGLGTIYGLARVDGQVEETLIDSFTNNGIDGYSPQGVVTFDKDLNLYSTTYAGGSSQYGTVFVLLRAEKRQKLLYNFTGGSDGGYLTYAVILDSSGNLYGTTQCGGSAPGCTGHGVVFEIMH